MTEISIVLIYGKKFLNMFNIYIKISNKTFLILNFVKLSLYLYIKFA